MIDKFPNTIDTQLSECHSSYADNNNNNDLLG